MTRNSSFRKNASWLTTLILIVVIGLLLNGCSAKESPKTYRVGILVGFVPFVDIAEGFKSEMAELGYIEGENIVYDVREVNVDAVAEHKVLEEFVADEVDLIFSFPTGPSVAAKAATQGTDIPVVFAMAGIEESNLVNSIRQPGGNITGVRFAGPDSTVKRFEFLLQLVPDAKRVYVTFNENYPGNHPSLVALRPAAEAAGVTLVEEPVASVEELQANLQARANADDIGMDAILIMPDDLTQSPDGWPVLAGFAAEHQIPVGGAANHTAEASLFSYVSNFFEVGELAAPVADKILQGTPAGEIPVVTPVEYLRLNYKIAQDLGLAVPDSMVSLASEVIRE